MSYEPTYELRETIRGVTFIYRQPGQNPTIEGEGIVKEGEGDFEDLLLCAEADLVEMVLMDAETPGNQVRILTRVGKGDFWRYRINTGSQTWQRRREGRWSAPRPVSDLRIKINKLGEKPHPIAEIQPGGVPGEEGTTVIYPGTTCRMVWNPATRRYVQVCTQP